ncbi:MAG: O-antigen ligase [Candidatus Pacebacteria bacterium]|nr:O-antigen ligase [Candidatus Paceibacterota bacterium]
MEFLEIFNLFLILFVVFLSGIFGWTRLKQNNVSCILYGYYLVIFGLAQLFAFVFNIEFAFPIEIKLKANILNIIVLFFIFLGEKLLFQKIKKTDKANEEKTIRIIKNNKLNLSILMWLTLILSMCGFVFLILGKGIPLEYFFSAKTRTVYTVAVNWFFVFSGSSLLLFVMISNYISLIKKNWLVLGIGALITLLAVSLAGTRAYVFFIIGPFLYYYISFNKINTKLKKIMFASSFIILFFIFFTTLHLWRWQEERTPQVFLEQLLDKRTYFFLLENPNSEFNYRLRIFQAVTLFPRENDWLYGNTYKNILLFWLPSGFSEKNKVDTMYKFADAIDGTTSAYERRRSIQPTLTGDFYINFGYLFWLPALIWGMGLSFVYIKARNNIFWNLLAGSSLVYFLALSLRGSIYLAFFQIITFTIFLICIFFILYIPRLNYYNKLKNNEENKEK